MKKTSSLFFSIVLVFSVSLWVSAQTTEFTYQGSLKDGGVAANANYDLQFALFDSGSVQVGPTLTRLGTAVTAGTFTVKLDFGNASFPAADRFLEIRVRPSGVGTYTTLAPRQQITSTPFSIRTLNAASADSLSGACVLCVTDAHIQSIDGAKLTGVITGNGSGLTGLNGANIAPGSISSTQLASDAQPYSSAYKLLATRRWDLLKGQAVFTVGSNPVGIEFDGVNIWVGNFTSNNVTKIRVSDGATLGTFAVGTQPWRIAFDGSNIWVANSGSGNVTKLRAVDGANLGTFTTGTGPNGVAFDGANIWVVNFNSGNVTKLRASDGANLGTFTVGSGPSGVAFDGANIWVANWSSSNVTKLRASDGANLGTFPTGSGPYEIVFDGNYIWTANRSGPSVSKIRIGDGANLGNFTVGLNPYAIAFDGTNIWTANRDASSVTKLRASDGSNLGTFNVGGSPSGIVFDGMNMWVTNFGGTNVTRLPPAFPGP